MSRIGKVPIIVPNNVKVILDSELKIIKVDGPKGKLNFAFSELLSCNYGVAKSTNVTTNGTPDDLSVNASTNASATTNEIVFKMIQDTQASRAQWGLVRSVVANMVKGVSEGFKKDLELVGVGYKASVIMNDRFLLLFLGYSHDIVYAIPQGIEIKCEKPTLISIYGCDKQLVGAVAAEIRAFRKPEPYKGKGVRYAGEYILIKAGKKR